MKNKSLRLLACGLLGLFTGALLRADPSPQAAAPSFSPAAGTYTSAQAVTIASATGGALIRYTLDGSTPTETNGTLYSGPLNLSSAASFNAIAYESGFVDSNVSTAGYTINNPPPQAAAPSFSPAAGTYTSAQTVTISSATSGASIRYTLDGSPPTETNGILYSGPVNLTSTVTFMAIAYQSGFFDSDVTTAAYTINLPPQVVAPVFSPAAGTYSNAQTVTITSTTNGATIRYTLDGSTPTPTTGTIYSGPANISSTATLKAVAYKGGFIASTVTVGLYAIGSPPPQVAAPLFSPAGGIYTSAQTVSITSATGGASFRYTLDGSTPTETNGTLYSGPVNFNSTLTFMAIAYEGGFVDSTVTIATYTINLPQQVVAPVLNSPAGAYAIAQIVTVTSATNGASIRYTLDGSTPSESSGTLYSSPVSISSTTTLTVIAYKAGFVDSPVTTGVYTISATTTPGSNPPPDSTSAPASGGGAPDEWFLGALAALGILRWWRAKR